MAGKIFINYRREDTGAEAAKLRAGLEQVFGPVNLLMDVRGLPGERFDIMLNEALDGTDVFLALIGARWLDLLEEGARRGEHDYVREEIAAALAAGIVVIPVLVNRAALPSEASLPWDIRELVRYRKHDVARQSFFNDTQALIEVIREHRWTRDCQAAAASRRTPGKERTEIVAKRRTSRAQGRRIPWPSIGKWAALSTGAVAAAAGMGFLIAQLWPERHNLLQLAGIGTLGVVPVPPQAGRIAVNAAIAHNAYGRMFLPGAGITESFKDCAVCPEMVVLPAGSFTMGSPESEPEREQGETEHKVTIPKPFAVGRFAVTFAEWDGCLAGEGCDRHMPNDHGWGRAGRPVINVDWTNAQAYVAWLSAKTGKEYRLLSEAEREYATRAGTETPYWWGSRIGPEQANFDGNYLYPGGGAKGEYREKTLPVKSFQPNPWGLFQVHGNLWEWTEDCWHGNYDGAPSDGSAWTAGDCRRRVLRGGSWFLGPRALRSACRDFGRAWIKSRFRGFRVARTLEP